MEGDYIIKAGNGKFIERYDEPNSPQSSAIKFRLVRDESDASIFNSEKTSITVEYINELFPYLYLYKVSKCTS